MPFPIPIIAVSSTWRKRTVLSGTAELWTATEMWVLQVNNLISLSYIKNSETFHFPHSTAFHFIQQTKGEKFPWKIKLSIIHWWSSWEVFWFMWCAGYNNSAGAILFLDWWKSLPINSFISGFFLRLFDWKLHFKFYYNFILFFGIIFGSILYIHDVKNWISEYFVRNVIIVYFIVNNIHKLLLSNADYICQLLIVIYRDFKAFKVFNFTPSRYLRNFLYIIVNYINFSKYRIRDQTFSFKPLCLKIFLFWKTSIIA